MLNVTYQVKQWILLYHLKKDAAPKGLTSSAQMRPVHRAIVYEKQIHKPLGELFWYRYFRSSDRIDFLSNKTNERPS